MERIVRLINHSSPMFIPCHVSWPVLNPDALSACLTPFHPHLKSQYPFVLHKLAGVDFLSFPTLKPSLLSSLSGAGRRVGEIKHCGRAMHLVCIQKTVMVNEAVVIVVPVTTTNWNAELPHLPQSLITRVR
jgi:hypothetical protein